MALERIIAMVVDTKTITLYRSDGSKIELAQGTPGIKEIVDHVLPIVTAGGIAEIEIDKHSNPYRDFELLASSALQFFRVAKQVIQPLFEQLAASAEAANPVITPVKAGAVPAETTLKEALDTPDIQAAVKTIMEQATPAASDSFGSVGSDETVIAKVGDTIVPGMENLKEHFKYSNAIGSTIGLEKLIQRMAAYVDKRQHSVEDLLRFLKKADLPIADDGSIIAYKVLASTDNKSVFVDKHTHKVKQRVGSFVCVDESLVDKNRRNECSNGLHIARRGYVGGFSSSNDVCMVTKIAPEDVIVVPHGDPSKVRVCAYHIVGQLSNVAYKLLRNDEPMTSDAPTVELLSKIVAGNHIDRIEEVRIHGQLGNNVTITEMVNGRKVKKQLAKVANSKTTTKHTALDDATKVEAEREKTSVNPKAVSAVVAEGGRKAEARKLMDIIQNDGMTSPAIRKKTAQQLLDFKKAKKVGWHALGISDGELTEIVQTAAMELPKAPQKPKEAPKSSKVPVEPAGSLSRQDRARSLFNKAEWSALWIFKKQVKISWVSLGFSNPEIEKIARNKPE